MKEVATVEVTRTGFIECWQKTTLGTQPYETLEEAYKDGWIAKFVLIPDSENSWPVLLMEREAPAQKHDYVTATPYYASAVQE